MMLHLAHEARRLVRATLLTQAVFFCTILPLHAAGTTPSIIAATIDYPTQEVTITGAQLAPATGSPTVKLDGQALTLVSSTASEIVAHLPAGLAPGSYQLSVNNGTAAGTFDLTFGASGP